MLLNFIPAITLTVNYHYCDKTVQLYNSISISAEVGGGICCQNGYRRLWCNPSEDALCEYFIVQHNILLVVTDNLDLGYHYINMAVIMYSTQLIYVALCMFINSWKNLNLRCMKVNLTKEIKKITISILQRIKPTIYKWWGSNSTSHDIIKT